MQERHEMTELYSRRIDKISTQRMVASKANCDKRLKNLALKIIELHSMPGHDKLGLLDKIYANTT